MGQTARRRPLERIVVGIYGDPTTGTMYLDIPELLRRFSPRTDAVARRRCALGAFEQLRESCIPGLLIARLQGVGH